MFLLAVRQAHLAVPQPHKHQFPLQAVRPLLNK
jgi:hypothetical protein